MTAAGVIVEFNPIHNGHIEHLNETRRLTGREHIVAVMSGNFVQRGEPAICDKWRRTKMALLAGADIVIELPLPYVISGADYFARGSVGLLMATGVVDALCFGSESGDLPLLMQAGRVLALEPDEYKDALRAGLGKGLSFAAARGAGLGAVMGDVPDGFLSQPNNGLGMEYCKALWKIGMPMEVFTSYRAYGGPSATAIRRAVLGGDKAFPTWADTMPAYAAEILLDAIKNGEIASLNSYSHLFRYLLFTQELCMGEGLENRFRHYTKSHLHLSDLLDAVKTKRYTYTRLQRVALGVILGAGSADIALYENAGGPQYIRVLGFRREAAGLLGQITKKASLPVITHGQAMDNQVGVAAKMLAKELEAGDIYKMAFGGSYGYRHERGQGIVIV